MKNDLTSAEWEALASFLEFFHPFDFVNVSPMTSTEENKKRAALAESGKEKFINIAKSLKPVHIDGPDGLHQRFPTPVTHSEIGNANHSSF